MLFFGTVSFVGCSAANRHIVVPVLDKGRFRYVFGLICMSHARTFSILLFLLLLRHTEEIQRGGWLGRCCCWCLRRVTSEDVVVFLVVLNLLRGGGFAGIGFRLVNVLEKIYQL